MFGGHSCLPSSQRSCFSLIREEPALTDASSAVTARMVGDFADPAVTMRRATQWSRIRTPAGRIVPLARSVLMVGAAGAATVTPSNGGVAIRSTETSVAP